MHTVRSRNQVLIRLTRERWQHIIDNHDELTRKLKLVLDAVANPDIIIQGEQNELLAVRKARNQWLVVIYKEIDSSDGFVITAFLTSRIAYLLKKTIIWKKP